MDHFTIIGSTISMTGMSRSDLDNFILSTDPTPFVKPSLFVIRGTSQIIIDSTEIGDFHLARLGALADLN